MICIPKMLMESLTMLVLHLDSKILEAITLMDHLTTNQDNQMIHQHRIKMQSQHF